MAELDIIITPVWVLLGGLGTYIIIMFSRIMKVKRYPVKVLLAEQRENSIVWDTDERAKRERTKDGYETYQLMKKKVTIKPPKYENVYIDTKGKAILPLFNTSSRQFFPMTLNSPKFTVVEDKGTMNWNVLEHRRTRDIYKENINPFLKYAPYIMTGMLGAIIIFLVIFMTQKFEVMSESISGASSALAKAVEIMAGKQVLPPAPGG